MWLAAVETHPFSVHTLRAIEEYSKYRAQGLVKTGTTRATRSSD